MPSEQFQQFYQTLMSQTPRGDLTILQMRSALETMMSGFVMDADLKVAAVEFKHCTGVWIVPPKVTSDQVLLFLHGGAYSAGSWQSHQDLIGRIAKGAGIKVLAINYRLAPESHFPAALNDALEAYELLQKQHIKVIVGGTSAGGGLALALILKLRELKKPEPCAAVLLCPWVDLALTGITLQTHDGKDLINRDRVKKAAQAYVGPHDPKDPLISPLYGDLTHLPPLLIQVGTVEILWSEIEALAGIAAEGGTHVTFEPYDGMFHTWQLFAAKIPEGQQAIDSICKYIKHLKT